MGKKATAANIMIEPRELLSNVLSGVDARHRNEIPMSLKASYVGRMMRDLEVSRHGKSMLRVCNYLVKFRTHTK